jgi:hypothetical protein
MMDLVGLEEIRKGVGLTPECFAQALAAAAGKLVDKPLREIELHEVAVIYAACAEVADQSALESANGLRSFFGLDPIERAAT